jgi:pimeloyl-ACP methyl ester carboxylesterase
MPTVKANNLTINYDQQGTGEPLILIPYLAADHACYAFQVPEYTKHFTCISLDPRGAGGTDKPDGVYEHRALRGRRGCVRGALGIGRATSRASRLAPGW